MKNKDSKKIGIESFTNAKEYNQDELRSTLIDFIPHFEKILIENLEKIAENAIKKEKDKVMGDLYKWLCLILVVGIPSAMGASYYMLSKKYDCEISKINEISSMQNQLNEYKFNNQSVQKKQTPLNLPSISNGR